MVLDELKFYRCWGKCVYFDGDEEKKWVESKEVFYLIIDKYVEEV